MKKAKKKNRKNKGSRFKAVVFIIVALLAVWIFNTFTLKTTEVTIKNKKIKNDITIVQITDLHGAEMGINNSFIIKAVDKAKPDLVFITGDMYTSGSESGKETAEYLINRLAEKYEVYFVNGEHDNEYEYKKNLSDHGVHVMDYKTDDITIEKTNICLYGINNVYYTPTFNLKNEFTLNKNKYNILLAHIDNKDAFTKFGIDLSVCGDTHGGQVRLPLIGGINSSGIWFPELKDKNACVKGLYNVNGKNIFISSGVGNYPIPVRFLNRPEIAVIHLAAEQ